MAVRYTALASTPSQRHRTTSPGRFHLPPSLGRWRTACLLFNLGIFASLVILSLITYLSPSNGYMRPCLPFSLHRLSSSAHRTLSCQYQYTTGTTNTNMDESDLAGSRLAGFLQSQKELFYGDLRNGKGKGWTVAMGNEAGGEYEPSAQA